jgi:hypothetical protein
LLSATYELVRSEGLDKKHSESAETLEQIDKIIEGKLKLNSDQCTIANYRRAGEC